MAELFGDGSNITGTVNSDGNLNITGTSSEGEVFGKDTITNVVATSQGKPGTPGANGKGWTAASYNESTGVATFMSVDGLGFDTADLRGTRGQNGLGWTSGNYDNATGVASFVSSDGLSFATSDLRGAGGEVNVQADYTETATTSDAYIKNKPTIPTTVSSFTNDSGYLTSHQDISGKQNSITDLSTIRSGAAAGATALQSHQDISDKVGKVAGEGLIKAPPTADGTYELKVASGTKTWETASSGGGGTHTTRKVVTLQKIDGDTVRVTTYEDTDTIDIVALKASGIQVIDGLSNETYSFPNNNTFRRTS